MIKRIKYFRIFALDMSQVFKWTRIAIESESISGVNVLHPLGLFEYANDIELSTIHDVLLLMSMISLLFSSLYFAKSIVI